MKADFQKVKDILAPVHQAIRETDSADLKIAAANLHGFVDGAARLSENFILNLKDAVDANFAQVRGEAEFVIEEAQEPTLVKFVSTTRNMLAEIKTIAGETHATVKSGCEQADKMLARIAPSRGNPQPGKGYDGWDGLT